MFYEIFLIFRLSLFYLYHNFCEWILISLFTECICAKVFRQFLTVSPFWSTIIFSISNTFGTSKSTNEVKSIKIFCYVLNNKNVEFVGKTWGKRCNRLVLLYTKHLKNKWREEQEALRHVYFSYKNNFDWFVRADVTSFFFVENLRKFLSNYSKNMAYSYDFGNEKNVRKITTFDG